MKPLIILLLALCAGFTSRLPAQVFVTSNATAPTDNIILSNTAATTTNLSFRYTGNGTALQRDVGQTFTVASAVDLDKVVLFQIGGSSTSSTRNFTLTIESFATTLVDSARTLVSAQTGALQSLPTGNQWVTFDLGTSVSLSTGTVYGFRFAFDTMDATSEFRLDMNSSYAGGTGYQIVYSTSSTPSAVSDARFYLQTVPEPSTVALAVAGGSVLMLIVRRRRRQSSI
jgi:hypothetical protein